MTKDRQPFPKFCRDIADRLRRLADETTDTEHRAELLVIADELDARAVNASP